MPSSSMSAMLVASPLCASLPWAECAVERSPRGRHTRRSRGNDHAHSGLTARPIPSRPARRITTRESATTAHAAVRTGAHVHGNSAIMLDRAQTSRHRERIDIRVQRCNQRTPHPRSYLRMPHSRRGRHQVRDRKICVHPPLGTSLRAQRSPMASGLKMVGRWSSDRRARAR